jgi:hypothetical protein
LFEACQKLRRPDEAYCAASVAAHRGEAEERERFVFEEHRPNGALTLMRPLDSDAWDKLAAAGRDRQVEAVLAAVAPAAIAARLAQRVHPALDQALRQDLQKSTASIVRSFVWAGHFLGVAPPAIYVQEDAPLALAAAIAEEPSPRGTRARVPRR